MVSSRVLQMAVWFGTGLLWGTTWVVIRIGLRDIPPFTLSALRAALAAATLLAFAMLFERGKLPPAREVRFWAAIGAIQIGIPYALIFWAEVYISAGLTAMLFATFPAFTAVTAHFLLKHESLTVRKAAGTLLALVAVALLVGATPSERPPVGAVVAVLTGSVAAAFGAVMVRRHGQSTSTTWLTTIQISSAAALLVVLAVVFEAGRPMQFNLRSIAVVLYLAWVITVACYVGLFWLLKRLDATFVSMGVIFETTVGVFLGAWALGEPLGGRVFSGLALVGLSIYLVTVRPRGAATVVP